MRRLFALLRESPKTDRHAWASDVLRRSVTTYTDLTDDEIGRLVAALEYPRDDAQPYLEEPCGEPGCIGHDPADGWCVDADGNTWLSRVGARR